MQQLKAILTYGLSFALMLLAFHLNAVSYGFSINQENIFLKKNSNSYYPEIISSFNANFFLSHSFIFKNASFSLTPALFIERGYNIKKKEIRKTIILPFIKQFNLSIFTEHMSFTLAKDTISFGEDFFNLNNYFFINVPIKNVTEPLYHISFEFPINSFSLSFGSTIDTDSLDHYKKPCWYSTYLNAFYSNNILLVGLESDVLFQETEKKDIILKIASEASFFLPLDFKIYLSGKLPISLYEKKVKDWGIFIGLNKPFILEDYTFTPIIAFSYADDGFYYSIFQNAGIKEFFNITAGMKGKNLDTLNLIFEVETIISSFKFKISYITKNLLKKDEFQGFLSVGASLNE